MSFCVKRKVFIMYVFMFLFTISQIIGSITFVQIFCYFDHGN